MSSTYSTRFELNGHTVYAEYLYLNRSGRLTIEVDGNTVDELEWVEWSDDYATDAGLREAAVNEIRLIVDAVDSGDIDPPPAATIKALREVVA